MEQNYNITSTKANKIDMAKIYIARLLDNSQLIKRYCTYLTKTPLATSGKDLNGDTIGQPDITESIMKDIKINVGIGNSNIKIFKQTLIPYMFNARAVNVEQVFVFVHNFENRYGQARNNNLYQDLFRIDILVPAKYDVLEPYGTQRIHKIIKAIIDLLDGQPVDKTIKLSQGSNTTFYDILGDLKFEIVGNSREERIGKSEDIVCYPLTVEIKTPGVRKDGFGNIR